MLTIAQAIARSASLYPENRLTYIGSDGSSKSYTMVEVETKSAENRGWRSLRLLTARLLMSNPDGILLNGRK